MDLLAATMLKMLSVDHSLRESLLRWWVYLVSHYSEKSTVRKRCVIRKYGVFFLVQKENLEIIKVTHSCHNI